MPPTGMKHLCKHCKKSFPSGKSLGGHMALHRDRRKKQRSGTSSDDDPWALFPKTECQLCFKSFSSRDALSIHMRVHMRRRNKLVVEHNNVSIGDGDHNLTVFAAPVRKRRSRRIALDTFPSPLMMTYGIEEVDAAHILVMLSGDHGMCSAFVDYDQDCEMDGNVAYDTPMAEMELSSSDHHGLIGDDELMEPETSSSYGEMKFVSLSEVIKATTSYECKLCGRVFASGQALGGHQKGHRAIRKYAAMQPCKQHKPFVLCLPASSIWNYRGTRSNSDPNPLWAESSLQGEQLLGVV